MAPRLTEPTAADWAAVGEVVVAYRELFAYRLTVALKLCQAAEIARYGTTEVTRYQIAQLAREWDQLTTQVRAVSRDFHPHPERGPGAHRARPSF
jgi:hypothetical protein